MATGTGSLNSILKISALSRPLDVGTLYDARSDKLIPGSVLWKMEDIKEKSYSSPQKGNRFKVSASESLKKKTDLLDMSASVKLSFFAGLIKAEGSAKYLYEKTSSTHQCRVTLDYHETTESRELMISELGAPDPEVLSKTDATHVVTMVLYGADAIMEFQQTASDESQKQEIEGNLRMMITMIPAVEISGEGSLNMNDEEKDKVKNFTCEFYGDYKLPEVPTSFEEAVKVYKQLPSLLGENGEKAVPVKVWLYPLSKLGNTESKLKTMISDTLVSAVEKMMDDHHLAEIRTNDLLVKSNKIKAEDITTKLKKFQSILRDFTSRFLNKMTDLIPAIRGGDMEDTKLKELLDFQDASGFSGKEMKQWLDGKEAEINIVTMYLKKLDYGIKTPGPELESFLMDPDVTDAFVFSFTSLKDEEPYLNKIFQTSTTFKVPTEEVPWYRRPEVKEVLNSAVNVFNNKIYSKNKLISFIPDPEHFGASVGWYHNAVLKDAHVTTDPNGLTLDPNTASRHVLLSEGNRKAIRVNKKQPYPDHPDRFDDDRPLVLSREPLIGRCYWEVEWSGYVAVGVAYKSVSRSAKIGDTDKAWSLECYNDRYTARHSGMDNRLSTPSSGSKRVRVFVDREAGIVSFYRVSSDTHTLLHTFYITHTDEPLHAVFYVFNSSSVTLV